MKIKTKIVLILSGLLLVCVAIFVIYIFSVNVLWLEIPPSLLITKGIAGDVEGTVANTKSVNLHGVKTIKYGLILISV